VKRIDVVVSALAHDDMLQAAAHYLGEGSTSVAIAFVTAIEQTLERVRAHPAAGSPRYAHELNLPGLRCRSVTGFPYLVFYRMEAGTVTVWRVLHAERDIPAHLRDPE
jgi:toxin ParE1/3/4